MYVGSNVGVIIVRISRYPDRSVGEEIRKWRMEGGLFQRDLAKMIGVKKIIVPNWEREKTKPVREEP